MKRLILLLILQMSIIMGYSQNYFYVKSEYAKPSYNKEIKRQCLICDIEGKEFTHVTVELKSKLKSSHCYHRDRVKVVIKDAHGKKLYKKMLDAHLYIYLGGQIQVGRPDFDQLVIFPLSFGQWHCVLRENIGV